MVRRKKSHLIAIVENIGGSSSDILVVIGHKLYHGLAYHIPIWIVSDVPSIMKSAFNATIIQFERDRPDLDYR
jgi:hypothetical protein